VDITFACPRCQQKLKATRSGLGGKVACPKCGGEIVLPAPAPPPAANGQDKPAEPRFDFPDGRPAPKEPWFYGYLDKYARVLMALGSLLYGMFFVGSFVAILVMQEPKTDMRLVFPAWLAGVAIATLVFLLWLVSVAFILLTVDQARNVRRICLSVKARE
jgi:hypothetical protein